MIDLRLCRNLAVADLVVTIDHFHRLIEQSILGDVVIDESILGDVIIDVSILGDVQLE